MGDNGNKRTFGQQLQQLAAAPNVPIIGQPFVLEGWFLQILLTCRCAAPKPVLIIGQPRTAAGQCPSCHAIYSLLAMGLNAQGQPQFNVGMSAAPAAGDTNAAPPI